MTDNDNADRIFKNQQQRALKERCVTIRERKQRLRNFERFLLTNKERILESVHRDFQKPLAEIEFSELYPVVTEIRHAIENLDRWTSPRLIDAPINYLGTRSTVIVEPKGVCLIIAPWNFPLNLCLGPLVSCLAAGNTAILKPSETTPFTSALIRSLVSEFFEEDLVCVVEGDASVAEHLISLPFDHIFFTGSTTVGKRVMKAASENLTSVTLELGGKSPTIVHKSANLHDAAKRIAFGKFLNSGQTCIAPDYVLVDESIKTKFIDALKENVMALFGDVGGITRHSTSYSRIVNDVNYARLLQLMTDAIEEGAIPELSGPHDRLTRFIHPVILSNVASNSNIMKQEIFGPILPVISYKSETEIVEVVNQQPKPLALYIFSSSKKFTDKILLETTAGSVGVNDCVLQFSHPNLPFGGVGNSGVGKAHGKAGFLAFSNEKPVLKQKKGWAMFYLIYPPYTPTVRKIINMMIRWI